MAELNIATFSDLATTLGINRSKVMHYEREGLIFPYSALGSSGTKLFDKTETVKRIRKIIQLRDKGLSLEEIKAQL